MPGTEVHWLRRGEYQPDTDAVMNFRRALRRQKPYCLLMNTDYAKFTADMSPTTRRSRPLKPTS